MINKIDLNSLFFSETFTGRFQNKFKIKGQCLIFFNKDQFTSMQIDVSSFSELDFANINMTLVSSDNSQDDVSLKSIVEDGELIYENNIIYYKASKLLTSDLDGCFYLKVDNSSKYIYSNDFSFQNLGYATADGEGFIVFSKTASSSPLEIILKSTTDTSIAVDWGDSGSDTQTVTSTGTTFSKTYTINADYQIKIGGDLTLISEIQINNESITSIADISEFTNLDILNLDDCKYKSVALQGLINLNEYYANDTSVLSISGFSGTKGGVLSVDNCINIELNSQSFAALNTKLKTFSASGCRLQSIANAYTNDGWTLIESIDLSDNNLRTIPVFTNNTTLLASENTIRSIDVSSNAINGDPGVSAYINTYGIAFFSRCESFDFSYNSINQESIDMILELIAFASITALRTSIDIDLSGFNKRITGNPSNAAPSNRITALEPILGGGINYVVGDVLTPTGGGGTGGSIIITSVDSSGTITGYDVNTYGSGYTSPAIVISGGSGTGVSILVKSAKVRMVDDGATVITN